MPSGKTHDFITFFLSIPIFLFSWGTFGFRNSAILTSMFLFGGLAFGPDLDTNSLQFRRWNMFRFIWIPYRLVFKHRSRWTHGAFLGTFFRVVYFAGFVSILAFLAAYLAAEYFSFGEQNLSGFMKSWHSIGKFTREKFGAYSLYIAFAGVWLGALSHILADKTFTFIKTGRY
ncbi:MAG: metal-binding protein [Pyrinomonadaceae bacterium]